MLGLVIAGYPWLERQSFTIDTMIDTWTLFDLYWRFHPRKDSSKNKWINEIAKGDIQ